MAKNSSDFLEDFHVTDHIGQNQEIQKICDRSINPWAAVEAQLKRFRKCWDRPASVHNQMFPFSLRFAQNKIKPVSSSLVAQIKKGIEAYRRSSCDVTAKEYARNHTPTPRYIAYLRFLLGRYMLPTFLNQIHKIR